MSVAESSIGSVLKTGSSQGSVGQFLCSHWYWGQFESLQMRIAQAEAAALRYYKIVRIQIILICTN